LSAGAVTSCGPSGGQTGPVTANEVYTNNQYLPGAGYYHAPFRAWFTQPYNHFDPATRRYFYGGQWGPAPHESFTNISSPTPAAAASAQAQRTDVRRGGFGSSSRHWSTYS
ncbi:MAG: hypothetical protein NTW03_20695, partial [Verrucomicrobia bacterium]|nr:hypothetical protein [Verrucomicrobiota bacterium]